MAWVKVDDGFFNNQKILSVSKDAKIIYLAGLCHAGATLSDGFIPRNAVAILAAQGDVRSAAKAVSELVNTHLWIAVEGGYTIHDYLEHNTSSEDVLAKREQARIRMERRRSQNVRANKPRSSGEVRLPETEIETETELATTSGDVVEAQAPPTPPRDSEPPEPKPKRAAQIPVEWQPSDGLRTWAIAEGLTDQDIEREVPQFVDHFRGKGEPRKDWDASFRKWMRNARQWGHTFAQPPKSSDRITSIDELFATGADDERDRNQEDSGDITDRLAPERPGQTGGVVVDAGPGRDGFRALAGGRR